MAGETRARGGNRRGEGREAACGAWAGGRAGVGVGVIGPCGWVGGVWAHRMRTGAVRPFFSDAEEELAADGVCRGWVRRVWVWVAKVCGCVCMRTV